jgi:kinesin family protein 2/24
MSGIQNLVAEDVFMVLSGIHGDGAEGGDACTVLNTFVSVSFFEIYGGGVQDLLNDCKRLRILEDGKGEVVVSGLEEYEANTPEQMLNLMEAAQR